MKNLTILLVNVFLGFLLVLFGIFQISLENNLRCDSQQGFIYFYLGLFLWMNVWIIYNDT
jgi:ABC-type arginine/histidine transport system permease subunit